MTKFLSLPAADIRDALNYWVSVGIFEKRSRISCHPLFLGGRTDDRTAFFSILRNEKTANSAGVETIRTKTISSEDDRQRNSWIDSASARNSLVAAWNRRNFGENSYFHWYFYGHFVVRLGRNPGECYFDGSSILVLLLINATCGTLKRRRFLGRKWD